MKKYIATWVYLDSPEEKSKYPNTGGDSTSPEFQAVYWRCIVLFYETSLRFHKDMKHLFFTNTEKLPIVDGLNIKEYFNTHDIEVICLKNLYPLPNNYFGSFRNQFFEFSIIDHIAKIINKGDMLMLLDSDCVFVRSLEPAFDEFKNSNAPATTYIINYKEKYEMHGLHGKEMKAIYEDLGLSLNKNPYYSGGELLFAKASFFIDVAEDFKTLYDYLMERHRNKKIKFNEEAHVLSYYYYKLGATLGGMDNYIRRIWTNRNYFRNVRKKDLQLSIWHLPSEKRVGIHNLFKEITENKVNLRKLPYPKYLALLQSRLLKYSNHKWEYYKYFKNKFRNILRNLGFIHK